MLQLVYGFLFSYVHLIRLVRAGTTILLKMSVLKITVLS